MSTSALATATPLATASAAPPTGVGAPAATAVALDRLPWADRAPGCSLGIVRNEPSPIYHGTPAVGIHRLATFGEGHPALYHWQHIQGNNKDQTPAMLLGRGTHSLLLEGPVAFATEFVVAPEDMAFNTVAGKAWKNLQAASGKAVFKHDDFVNIGRMRTGFLANPDVQERLMAGEPEVVVRKVCSRTGLLLQARFDWLDVDSRMALDLKTTSKELEQFVFEVEDRHYTRQVAWYSRLLAEVLEGRDGLPFEAFADIAQNFLLVGQETFPTWRSQAFNINLDKVRLADNQNQGDLIELARSISAQIWTDRTGGIITLDPRK